ncbi:MAG TPA: hypothetical protein VIJ29_00035 [Candidatus Paceibacterota bacterium]
METSNGTSKRTIVIVVVVVLIVAVIIAVVAFGNHAAAPTTQSQPAATTPGASYTSPSDKFAVNFPGTPDVTNTTFDSPSAGTIPMTEYKESASGGTANAYDFVFTYHYPASYTFPATYLSGALTEFAASVSAKYPGATIIRQGPTQFLGAPAISADIEIPDGGDTYLLVITKGQNGYIIGTYGLPQSDYLSFVGSFVFNQ